MDLIVAYVVRSMVWWMIGRYGRPVCLNRHYKAFLLLIITGQYYLYGDPAYIIGSEVIGPFKASPHT